MDKIDELKAKVKELEQEKRIAELELQIAQLKAEIEALRPQVRIYPNYWIVPATYPPYTITYSISAGTYGDTTGCFTEADKAS